MPTRALALLTLSLWPALAQDPRSAIAALNKALAASDTKALSRLFTPDSELRMGRKTIAAGADAIAAALTDRAVWSEVSTPRIGYESIRLLSPDLALVDAEQTRYGSMIGKQSISVILLLKRTSESWQILSLRPYP